MCEALELSGSERVLDVGPGLGYRAAVVAGVCAEVVAIAPSSALVERAQPALRRTGVTKVRVVTGEVAARHAPYDAIILATPGPASGLESPLADGGRLLAPDASGERLLVSDPRDGGRPVRCMPLLPAAPIG